MMIDIWQPDPHKLDLTWIILKYQKIIQAAYSYITSYHIVSCINPTFIVDVYCSTLFICMRENFVRFIIAIAFLLYMSPGVCLQVYYSLDNQHLAGQEMSQHEPVFWGVKSSWIEVGQQFNAQEFIGIFLKH